MRLKRIVAGLCGLGVVVAVVATGASQAVGASSSQPKKMGTLNIQPVRMVNASAPPTGFAPSKPTQAPLGRTGGVAGANLPAHPATGSKTGAKSSGPTPLITTTNAFNGIDLAHANCGCQPPDPNATVGPNNIVETVNLEFAVYDKAGNLLTSTSLNNFFGTSDGLSDPRVLYDPTWDRWSVVLTDTSQPALWWAFSATNNPAGAWYIYFSVYPLLPATGIADYPIIGQDGNAYIYTTNNFNDPFTYAFSAAFAIPKARVYNNFGWGATLYGVPFNTTPSITGGHPTEIGNFSYLLNAAPNSPYQAGNGAMNVFHFANTGGNPVLVFDGAIPYNWDPPQRRVNQPGTAQTLDPLDGRLDWANTQLNGRVWFAHGADIVGFPDVNWGYVVPGNMTIHVNTAFHSATSDDFNPSIADQTFNGVNQVVVNWAYTDTPNNVPTRDVADYFQGNAPTHLGGTVYSGPGNSTGEFRFGDFSSVAPEYNAVGGCAEGLNFVVTNQWFSASGDWATRIARVHRSGC
jgi:hypothetical protein